MGLFSTLFKKPHQDIAPVLEPQVLAEAETPSAPVEVLAEEPDIRALVREETLAIMSELAPTLGALDGTLQVLAAGEVARRQVPAVMSAQDSPQERSFPHAMENARQFTDWTNPRSHPPGFIDADTLRVLARSYDPLASCIAHLKDQVLKTPVFVVPKTDGDKTATTQKQIEAANAFFGVFGGLGGEGTDRLEFEGKWLDDLLIIGACALHCEYRTVGSLRDERPDAIKPIDASTIRPLITPYGWAPGEGDTAFEQWVQGKRVAGFARSEMIYTGLPIFAQSHSPYFLSAVELLVMLVFTALKSDEWNRTWLTDGNVPDSMVTVPKEWTPEQIKSYEAYFNRLMSGNSRQRHRAPIVPEGTAISHQTRKDANFQAFEAWLMTRTCSLMGVNPASIGHHGDTYKDSQEIAKDSTRENRVAQLLRFRAVRYSDLCARMGWNAIHVVEELPASEDAKERAERQEIELRSGTRTINECRAEAGEEPMKIEGADELFIAGTLVPLSRALEPPESAADNGKPNGKPPGQSDSKSDDKPSGDKSDSDVKRGIDTGTPDLPIRENLEGERAASTCSAQEIAHELKQWERKAINRLERGKSAACAFESECFDVQIEAQVLAGLGECASKADVRRVFESVVQAS